MLLSLKKCDFLVKEYISKDFYKSWTNQDGPRLASRSISQKYMYIFLWFANFY